MVIKLKNNDAEFTYKDNSNNKALNMWVVSDNLLKGAALNTVQIAETLIKKIL